MDLISLWRGRKMHLMHLRFNTPALELFRYVCYYESGSDSESWPMSLEEVKPAQESLQLIWWGGRLGCHGTIGRTTTYRLRFNVFHNCSFASKRPQMYYFVICINKCGFSRRVCPLVWQSMGGSMGMFPGWGIDPTESAAGTGVLVSAPIHPTQEMHCCCYFCVLQIPSLRWGFLFQWPGLLGRGADIHESTTGKRQMWMREGGQLLALISRPASGSPFSLVVGASWALLRSWSGIRKFQERKIYSTVVESKKKLSWKLKLWITDWFIPLLTESWFAWWSLSLLSCISRREDWYLPISRLFEEEKVAARFKDLEGASLQQLPTDDTSVLQILGFNTGWKFGQSWRMYD